MADAAVSYDTELIHDRTQVLPASRRFWILLAGEALLFGVLVLVYIIYREQRPEVIRAGRRYLDIALASGGTALLLASSLAMMGAMWAAGRERRRAVIVLLLLTLLGGLGFLGLKAAEYEARWRRGLFWADPYRRAIRMDLRRQRMMAAAAPAPVQQAVVPDADRGKTLYAGTCSSCHGDDAMGLPKLGVRLVASKFVGQQDDLSLLGFLKAGRGPTDPVNTTGVAMPPRGGNPTLTDDKLRDIVAYLRELQKQEVPATILAAENASGAGVPSAIAQSSALSPQSVTPAKLTVHRYIVPLPEEGPAGLAPRFRTESQTFRAMIESRQADLDAFFGLYFAVIGAHGLHVLIGLGVVGWLLVRVIRQPFRQEDCGPLCAGGLYWVLAGAVWVILFPLMYL